MEWPKEESLTDSNDLSEIRDNAAISKFQRTKGQIYENIRNSLAE